MVNETSIPAGYKKTEVGIIPIDWEVKKLGEIADVKTGPFGSALHERDYVEDGTPIITVEHLGKQGLIHENLPMVSDIFKKSLNTYTLKPDDIVFSRVGSVDRNSLIKEKENGWLFSGRILRIRLNTRYIYPAYISYHLHHEPTKQRIRNAAVGQTMPSLNTKLLKNVEVTHPSKKEEQQAIAAVLSDVDALITALDRLIEKKRNIKQGAMQQLLSGQKRLPGFTGKWKTKKLGEVGDFKNGINKGKEDFGFGYPFVNLLDVFGVSKLLPNSELGLVNFSSNERKLYELKKGDVLFVRSSVKPEGVGLTSVIDDDLKNTVFSGFLIRFRDFGELSLEFKVYCFNEEGFRKSIIGNSTVSANTNINQNSLKRIQIEIPPLPEQEAIAQVLSGMDAEIEALEKQRDKYKAVKNGMMHRLLTGKTRLGLMK